MSESKHAKSPAYTGSCVCGAVRYVLLLDLPPDVTAATPIPDTDGAFLEIYKCNCTTCHKMGFFHVRPPNAHREFFLLSPLDPFAELADFTILSHWFFCKKCGVRCFTFSGEGEVTEQDFEALGGENARVAELGKTQAWHPKEAGLKYFSLNALTLDAKQEGLDLREWAENKWVGYLDCLDNAGEDRYDRPHVGGAY